MGHESKLYIVDKCMNEWLKNKSGKVHADVLAMFNLSKLPALAEKFHNAERTNCFIYADDGDTEIIKDCYGDELREANLETVISWIESLDESDKQYRRVPALTAALKAFRENEVSWESLAVLHYGY